jgi:Pregnancy-associated plasma protein-A
MRTRTPVVVGLAAALLVLFAMPASAAQSGVVQRALFCDTSAQAASDSARVGDTAREPELNMLYKDLPASAVGKGKKVANVVVPVWFHVVHDNGLGNVSDADIDRQIRIMNQGFAGFYGGFDTGFRFELEGITRTNNAEWFQAGPTTSGERAMKHALRRGDQGTLNYYSTTAGVYLGWAYFPGLNDSQAYLDGIVVDWESMYKTSDTYEGRFDLGFTAVHEAGHWFALEHTFAGGCNAHGDFVDDTPAMKVPTGGCPPDGSKDTCTKDPGFDPIHNFMDYSDDPCYTQFTEGQTMRARDHWLAFRA